MKLLCRWPQLALKVRYTDSLNINAGPIHRWHFYRASNYVFTGQSFLETVIWLFCRVICWWFSEKMYTDYIAWYKGFQSQKMCYLCQICNDLKTGQDFESIEIVSNDKIKFKPQNESIGNLLKPIHYEINFRFCKLEVQITSWGVSKKKKHHKFSLFAFLYTAKCQTGIVKYCENT